MTGSLTHSRLGVLGLLALAALLVIGLGTAPSQGPAENKTTVPAHPPGQAEEEVPDGLVPLSAPLQSAHVAITAPSYLRLPRYEVDVQMALARGKVVLLPVLMLGPVQVSLPRAPGKMPLFEEDGRVAPKALAGKDEVLLHVTVYDVQRSGDVSRSLLEAVRKADGVAGRAPSFADTEDSLVLTLTLKAEEGGAAAPLGRYTLLRAFGQVRHDVRFRVRGADLERLRHATRDDLLLQVACRAQCQLSKTDFEVAASSATQGCQRLANRLVGLPGVQQVLFAPVGGELQQRSAVEDLVHQYVEVVVSRREGRPDVDPTLVEKLVAQSLAGITEQVRLQEADRQKTAALLLNDRLALTGALGKVEEVVDRLLREDESKTLEMLETLNSRSSSLELGASGGVNLLSLGLTGSLFGGGSSSSTEQKKEVHERFRRRLQDASRALKGQLPAVTRLKVDQLQRLASGHALEHAIRFETVRKTALTFQTNHSFQAFELDAARARYEREQAAERDRLARLQSQLAEQKRLAELARQQAVEAQRRINSAQVFVRTLDDNKDRRTRIRYELFLNGELVGSAEHGGGTEYPEGDERRLPIPLARPVQLGCGARGRLHVHVIDPNCDWNVQFRVELAAPSGTKASALSGQRNFTHYVRDFDVEFEW
jgi:hypothetical protein